MDVLTNCGATRISFCTSVAFVIEIACTYRFKEDGWFCLWFIEPQTTGLVFKQTQRAVLQLEEHESSILSFYRYSSHPDGKRYHLGAYLYNCTVLYNCIVPLGFLPGEIRVAFPGKSRLRQSRATQPTVHAGCFSVSVIHRTRTWTRGSLTFAHMLMHAIAHGGVRTP